MKYMNFLNNELIYESINDRGLFKAVFMSGIPGSGKSSVLTKIKSGSVEPRIVNVDKVTEFLNINDIYSVYDKSKIISKNQLALYLNSALPLFIDTTGCNINRLKNRINALEYMGYDTSMVFINTSLETALYRAKKRIRKVPQEVIKEYYEKLLKFRDDVKDLFSFNMELNNDDGELTDEVIIKAYKKISFFYDGVIQNPIGKERYDLMKKNNWKYLDPNIMKIDDIKKIIDKWYTN